MIMKKPIICDYEYSNRAIYRRDLEKYINYLEFQNKELIEENNRLKDDLKFRKSILSGRAQDL